jgi:hypothetical protein
MVLRRVAPSSPRVCPITQDEIRQPVFLRGVPMEVGAVLDLLASGAPRNHPYDRKPLTPAEIAAVHEEALRHEETRASLMEHGWMAGITDLPAAVPPEIALPGPQQPAQPAPIPPAPARAVSTLACCVGNFCGMLMTFGIANLIACHQSKCLI